MESKRFTRINFVYSIYWSSFKILFSNFNNVPMKKIDNIFYFKFLLVFTFFNVISINAQIVGTGAYIKGKSVEIGFSGAGGMEGTTAVPPVGMHPRGGFGLFGIVANPQVNSWLTFYGDFFTPGSPENGWGLQVGTSSVSPMFSNNSSGPLLQISSTPTISYSHILSNYNVEWSGSVISGTININAKINYSLQENDLFYKTTVSLTNNSASIIPMLYYYRNIDSDNNQPVTGSYTTNNRIRNQVGFPIGSNVGCVSSSQAVTTGGAGTSYIALVSSGADYRVSYGGYTNRSGSNLWNGVGNVQLQNSTNTADEAISLSYRIQNFLPGTTRTLEFLTVFDSMAVNGALSSLVYLSYPGSLNLPYSISTTQVDTIKLCSPNVNINVGGSSVNDYSWNWLPNLYLSSASTSSAVSSPTALVVYTITGTPIISSLSLTPVSFTIAVLPTTFFSVSASSNSVLCVGEPLFLNGYGGTNYSWSGPNSFTSSIKSPTINPTSLLNSGLYTVIISNGTGCIATTTVTATVSACVGINELNINNTFKLFPNPANEYLNILLNNPDEKELVVNIINAFGQIVMQQQLNTDNLKISTSKLVKGLYIVEISDQQNNFLRSKFIKE